MAPTDSIILGIVSGIVTSAVLFVLMQIFRKIIIPWYQSIIYSGIKVDGEWFSKAEKVFTQDIYLQIKQSAYQLSGVATYIHKVNPRHSDEIRTFNVRGNIKDRFIQLVFTHTDTSRIGSAVYLVEVLGDGRLLKGQAVIYDINKCEMASIEIAFKRKELIEEVYVVQSQDDNKKNK